MRLRDEYHYIIKRYTNLYVLLHQCHTFSIILSVFLRCSYTTSSSLSFLPPFLSSALLLSWPTFIFQLSRNVESSSKLGSKGCGVWVWGEVPLLRGGWGRERAVFPPQKTCWIFTWKKCVVVHSNALFLGSYEAAGRGIMPGNFLKF